MKSDPLHLHDTIVAVSTPPGRGGIGVVRLSGPQAKAAALSLFRFGHEAVARDTVESHRMYYGWVCDGDARLDDGYLVWFESPNTFTGEDIVELQLHGSPRVLEQVVRICLKADRDVRLAEAGEFSKRAFLNGKIDLTQAEGIIDLIDAKTDAAARLATQQKSGKLGELIRTGRTVLAFWLAHVEALLDFPEDQVPEIETEKYDGDLGKVQTDLTELLNRSAHAWVYRDGLKITLVGAPNMGKSSLFNRLLDRDRAIVSEISGTTRDVLEEGVDIDGVPVVFTDTAGITESEDRLERLGIERSLKAIAEAELLLILLDSTDPASTLTAFHASLTADAREIVMTKPAIVVHNKTDQSGLSERREAGQIWLSAQADRGVDALRQMIVENYRIADRDQDTPMLTNLRHHEAIRQALAGLNQAIENRRLGLGWDVIAHELREAVEALSAVTGESVDADLHDQIFSRFCIGK